MLFSSKCSYEDYMCQLSRGFGRAHVWSGGIGFGMTLESRECPQRSGTVASLANQGGEMGGGRRLPECRQDYTPEWYSGSTRISAFPLFLILLAVWKIAAIGRWWSDLDSRLSVIGYLHICHGC